MLAQWTLKWDDVTYSFIQEFNGQYDEFGKWNQPFPNNSEDSYAFGLLERWGADVLSYVRTW